MARGTVAMWLRRYARKWLAPGVRPWVDALAVLLPTVAVAELMAGETPSIGWVALVLMIGFFWSVDVAIRITAWRMRHRSTEG